ncbi:peptidase family M3 [Teladorsagia circumcincta]|uniref:Peptidase family M3 n=1 Tax=Teladorsagia circumcincta TaxID=45464 RepID=A0A2G9TXN9_TELCI|nr:peptidase family M3 [Teladorsagia circumcincta]
MLVGAAYKKLVACRPSAEREIAVLLDVQSQCNGLSSSIGEWDVHYLSQIYKERAYGIEHYHEIHKFLNLGNLLSGLANLLNKLYGVRIEEHRVERGEMWDGNIIKLDVFSAVDRFLGTVYLDIDRRSTKAVGDCHFTVRCSKQVLQTVLRNPDGKCVRIEDAASTIASRFAFSSLEIMQQASYALFDLELHAPDAARLLREGRITTTNLFNSIITKALPHLDRQADTAFQHRFHHLVQYGAKYYSYMVARSAASLIWNSKFRDSPFSRTEGEKWMKLRHLVPPGTESELEFSVHAPNFDLLQFSYVE